jgi:hypothetical protein
MLGFLFVNYTSTHARTLSPMNIRTQTLLYEHLRKTVPAHLEIDEDVT